MTTRRETGLTRGLSCELLPKGGSRPKVNKGTLRPFLPWDNIHYLEGRLRPPVFLAPEIPSCCNPATSFTYDPAKIVGLGAALNGAGCLLRLELAPRRAWFGPR
jgi:hypothetical protein